MSLYKRVSTKNMLRNLLPDQDEFTQFVLSRKHLYMSKNVKNVLIVSRRLKDPGKFTSALIKANIEGIAFMSSKKWGAHGNDIGQSLLCLEPYLNQEEKNKIIDLLFLHQDLFYSYAKKIIAKVISNFVAIKDDQRIIGAINSFCRVASADTIKELIAKATSGIDNPDIIKIIETNSLLSFLKYEKYTQDEINSNDELRKSIIKDLANTTSLIKKIPFKIEAKLEDIKALPPALRFKFLQTVFKNEIYGTNIVIKRYYKHHYINSTYKNFKMPNIDKETMDGLLFSVSMNKTEDVSSWLGTYYKFLEFVENKKIDYYV